MKPLGLSAQMRWDRTVRRAVLPQPVPTRQHAPYLRVLLAFLAVATLLSLGVALSEHVRQPVALPGASPEIEAAFQRGLAAGQKRQQCTWRDVFEVRK